MTHDAIVLSGLDGSNPLAFLAALGVLRTLSRAWPEAEVRMAWVGQPAGWRPALSSRTAVTEADVLATLDAELRRVGASQALSFADDLAITPGQFRQFALQAMDSTDAGDDQDRRVALEFAAAFACDALATEQGNVQDTALRTMSGAGHQHFLRSMLQIIDATSADHLRKALFELWRYDDAVAGQTLRWDPADDSRYALQWRNPSGDPSRQQVGGMLGANRLAIEGLPLVTSAPVGRRLATTGFTGSRADNTAWTWPIWCWPASVDTCRSLLGYRQLLDQPVDVAALREVGICAAFRSRRITVGKFRNFTPATAVL